MGDGTSEMQARRPGPFHKPHCKIGKVARDPLLSVKAFWDIGVRDATAIWIVHYVGREIRALDYYEAVVSRWQRIWSGFAPRVTAAPNVSYRMMLPMKRRHRIRFEDHIRSAGFDVTTVPNQGKGAALKRFEAGRRLFPAFWFNEATCSPGLDALRWYEKYDEARNIGLGPEHDWSSHGADAFGLISVAYGEPRKQPVYVTPDLRWVV